MEKPIKILKKHVSGYRGSIKQADAVKAMGEHAEKTAISFSIWLNENCWLRDPLHDKITGKIMWTNYKDRISGGESKSIDQLFKMFKQEKGL